MGVLSWMEDNELLAVLLPSLLVATLLFLYKLTTLVRKKTVGATSWKSGRRVAPLAHDRDLK